MKQSSMMVSAFLILASVAAHAQLSADSNTIKSKARSIEREYSRNMREDRARQSSSGGAVVVEEGFRLPSSQGKITESEPSMPVQQAPNTYNVPSTPTQNMAPVQNRPLSPSNTSSSAVMTNSFDYSNNLNMREDRKVGAGLTLGGASGMIGAHVEFNFEDADGVIAGFGTGPGYNSFQIGWKHSFEGQFLTPYTTVSYSRWYNSRGRGNEHSQSDVLDRVLTEEEKRAGQFGTDFVNGSLGIQYNQLKGDLAGVSFFGEFTGMYEVKRSNLVPNGSIGAIYFF